MNRRLAGIVSVGLLALAACGGGGSAPKPPTYQLTGTITRAWGGPLAGVAVDLGGAATGTAATDASGRFTFPSVADGSYTLTPRLAGWVFTPAAPAVVVSGASRSQDFTADGAYTIGGAVSGAVTGGVTIALSGGGVVKPAATSAAGTGAYLFTGIPNGTYTLTPSLAGHTFTPAAPAVVVSGANATQDFVSAAALRIAGVLRWGPDPLSAATVRLTGARTALATSDAAGAYAFEGLAQGQTYTVTPATFGFQTTPATRTYTLAGSVTDADFTADAAGPATKALHGSLSYAGSRSGPVYVTVSGQFGPGSPLGGTGLASQQGPWSGRAFTVRNVQAMGFVSVRAWMDTLGVGRFVAGADPSVSFGFDTASGATDLGARALVDPGAPAVASDVAVSQAVAGDGTAVVIFDPPRDASGDLVADGFRVYWNDSATVDAAHTLGTVAVKAGSDFAVVHGLANGTPYWFAVEAWLGGAPLSGQRATTAAPVTPAPPAGAATISGTVGHPAVAAPGALYVVAQSGGKGPTSGVWWQRITNPAGTQTAYAVQLPPGTYVVFAFLDRGDDGAVGIGEPARFPDQLTSFFTAAAGANAGPTISLAGGNATPSLATARFATAFFGGAFFDLAVASAAKLPLAAAVSGPGLRGPLDLGLQSDAGGVGATLGTSFDPAPGFPFTGDAYTMEVTYADGSTETFQRPVTGSFGGPPGVIAPADLATGVATVPTFQWAAPPGASGSYGWVLELSTQSGDQDVWGTFLPGTQTSVVYDADGLALTPELAPFTGYAWNIIAIDPDGNRAGYGASFTTGGITLPLYDALDGPALDGQRWQTPQLSRAVVGGRAVLGVQADGMQARTVQGATYNNALGVLAAGGQRVTTLGATVTVPAASVSRTGAALLMGGIRLVYQPAANRLQPFPDGNMNVLIAALELYDDGAGPRLRRRFYHCNDGGCVALGGAGIVAVDPPAFTVQGANAFAPAAWDVPYALALSLDEASGVFTWTVQGGAFATPVSGTADVSAWAASVGMALATTDNGFSQALLFSRVSDDTGGSSGGLAPEFDDVKVGLDGAAATAWDDFGAGFLDPSRWGASDSDVWLAGGSLHLSSALTTVVSGGGSESTAVNVMYPGSFRAWQADVAIVDEVRPTPDSIGGAGLTGAFYNDGTPGTGATGDVRASITMGTGSASWSLLHCGNATCGSATSVGGTLFPSAGHPLGVGTVHALGVRWDPVARLFTFSLDDAAPVQVDPTTVLAAAPVASPVPRHPLHLLRSSTFIGSAAPAGSSARAEATFANVRGSAP